MICDLLPNPFWQLHSLCWFSPFHLHQFGLILDLSHLLNMQIAYVIIGRLVAAAGECETHRATMMNALALWLLSILNLELWLSLIPPKMRVSIRILSSVGSFSLLAASSQHRPIVAQILLWRFSRRAIHSNHFLPLTTGILSIFSRTLK